MLTQTIESLDSSLKSYKTIPSIYVACLASYNNGILYGKWIECGRDAEEVREEIREMLKLSPEPEAEEWAIHDYQGFNGYSVEEYSDLEELCAIAQVIEYEDNGELIIELMNYLGSGTTIEDAKTFLEENYQGSHKDLGDYAYNFCQDCGYEIPKYLEYYVDYDAMGRDWDLSGDIFTIQLDDGLHVFSNR